jgi:acylglycerol lipase
MKQAEGRFKGRKGLELFYQCWISDSNQKAVLLVVPGFAEHSGRYANLVNYFVPRDYTVCGLDHRGHGRSEGPRGYVDEFSDYVEDLRTFFELVRREHGESKIFLVGHSMGATIALAYVIQYQHDLAGLLISGAGLAAGASIPRLAKIAAMLLSLLRPKMGVMLLDATAISKDKAVVDAYVNDPLVYRGKITARMGIQLLKAIENVTSRIPGIDLPILIMHGTEDRLADPEGSRMLYEKVSSRDKTLNLYDGFYHEIFNEPEHERVFADMEAWLAARI